MSFEPPEGILDIGNATLRVGKLEVAETSGLNQGLLNIVKNNILINENIEYSSSNTWGIKLPTTWVAEFDVKGHSGKYVEFNFYNEDKTSNALGYLLNFKDTTLSLMYDTSLDDDQNILTTATIPTIVNTYRKVNIFFERGVISVSIDGTRYLYHKETDGFNQGLGVASRVVSATGGAFVNLFIEENAANSKFKNLRIVNGRFISDKTSNIAFIGGNLGVGVNSPQEALDIRGNMHFERVSNVSQIKVDSNVVTEYTGPHDRPLRKYPEVAMTANDNSTTSGYVVSRSSGSSPYDAWKAFDEDISTYWYSGSNSYYATSDGSATASAPLLDTGTDRGDWLAIEIPNGIKLESFKLTRHDASFPSSGTLYARNSSGDSWTEIYRYNGYTSGNTTQVFNVNSTIVYKVFALVARTREQGSNTTYGISLKELELYGHEEGSGSLDTTLKSVYNVPATTGTQLEVYYDGRETSSYSGSGTTVTDISPNTNNGTLNGDVGFDSTYKAFTFNGTTTRNITATLPSTVTGEYVHSVSLWVKADEVSRSGSGVFTFFTIGSASSTNIIALGVNTGADGDGIKYDFFNAGAEVKSPPITNNEWMHFVVTYSGGANNLAGAKRIYLNGKELVISQYGGASVSSPLSLPTSPTLTLGGQINSDNPPFSGSIANFRLYSKVLNADQVKELYNYQKDYFLGSKSQVTLYKGHLGVGVTEPSGQLELAGDERIQEYPPGPMSDYETFIPGHGVFCASASSYYTASNSPALPFDKNATTKWASENLANYNGTGQAYSASRQLGTDTVKGEYVVLKLPYKIKLKSTNIQTHTPSSEAVKDFIIYGSNDGNTWSPIFTKTSDVYNSSGTSHDVNSTDFYDRFAIVCTRTNGSTYIFALTEWRLFGTPGPTTLDKGSLTLGRSLDVPRVSRYDVDTETPRPEKLVLDFDTTVNSSPTDISGKGNHGTFNGNAFYSAVDKAFVFDGTDDVLYVASGTGLPTGDAIYTLSCWIKMDPIQPVTAPPVFYFGSLWTSNQLAGIYLRDGNKVAHDIGSTSSYTTNATITSNKWHHVVVVKRGTGTIQATPAYQGIFVDGVEITELSREGSDRQQALGAIDNISIGHDFFGTVGSGGATGFKGCVSNPKIYNVALEPSEVKKLYNLGRTGRSMVISDTAVGIGKVPEAQLDVRGLFKASTMHVPGTVVQVQAVNIVGDTSTTDRNSGHRNSWVKWNIKPRFKNSAIIADFKFLVYLHGGSASANGAECLVRRCVNFNPTNLSTTGLNVYITGGHNLHYYNGINPNGDHIYVSLTEVDTPNTTENIFYVLAFRPHIHGNHTVSIGNGGNQYATVRLMEIAQ